MTRSSTDHQGAGVSSDTTRGDARGTSHAAGSEPGGERSGAAQADDLAGSFFGTLGMLARFGLASHTRLLLGRDG